VLPGTLTGMAAHESATKILRLLSGQSITSVDIAYRESVAKLSQGPSLFSPAGEIDHLKDVIDPLSTPLSLCITGQKTTMQGTLGFYFRAKNDLYAATVRHVTHKDNEDNRNYRHVSCTFYFIFISLASSDHTVYVAAPKKGVLVMGKSAFEDYLNFIKGKIGNLNDTVAYLGVRAGVLAAQNDQASARELVQIENNLTETHAKIEALRTFIKELSGNWSKPRDRVIGFVDWSPPIGVAVPPHGYTRDLSVIKLDKRKFKNFCGNVLSLGSCK
jgi:hypothetical protein